MFAERRDMSPEEANEILQRRCSDECGPGALHSVGWYLLVEAGDKEACLDGKFSADELEAIAVWMRANSQPLVFSFVESSPSMAELAAASSAELHEASKVA